MGAANAKLFVEEGNREVPLGSAPFIIGRSDGCNLVLKGNGNASRKHAEIRFSDGRYMITDLGSHNGTKVNGQKVMEQLLGDGDAITIGGVNMKFLQPGAPRSQAVPMAAAPAPAPAPARASGQRPAVPAPPASPPPGAWTPPPPPPFGAPAPAGYPPPMPPGFGAPPPPAYAPPPQAYGAPPGWGAPAPAAAVAPPRPAGSFMGGPAAAGNEGTQFVDMNNLISKGPAAPNTEGTQFVDMDSLANAGAASASGDASGPAGKKKKLIMLGSLGAAVLIVLVVLMAMPEPKPTGPVFPKGTEYTRVKLEQSGFAYIALEHMQIKLEKEGIAEVRSNQNALNEIVVKGLKPGETKAAIEFDTDQWYIIDITVTAKEEWPPRWTDDDRLRAAEKLKKEGDSLYVQKDAVTEALVPAYYRYRKVIRLYDNCKFFPPTPYQESTERAEELVAKIDEMERNLTRSFWRNFRQRRYNEARLNLDDLLVLFPEDGADDDPLAKHGNKEKYHKYYLLGQRFNEATRGAGS